MTTIVLSHPNQHCRRFQVFGVYDGRDDHFTFAVQEFDVRDQAERFARLLMRSIRPIISRGSSSKSMLCLSRQKRRRTVPEAGLSVGPD